MAKKRAVEKNNHRKALVARYAEKRKALLAIANNEALEMEERFEARLKLAELPRNSSAARIRNRCFMTGRPRQLPQDGHLAHCTAGTRQSRHDPGPGEVELVTQLQ